MAFTDRLLTKDLFGITSATTDPVLPWTIVPLAISPLAMLMALKLAGQDKRGMNPSKPAKSAIGLLLGGIAFLPMAYAAHLAGINGVASVWWLVLAYAVLEFGELSISPIGLSAVTQLSVPRVVSVMMGAWFLATAYSEVLAAKFGELTAMDVAEGETLDVAMAAARYGDLFMMMFWIGIVASAVAFALVPLVRKGMHGVK